MNTDDVTAETDQGRQRPLTHRPAESCPRPRCSSSSRRPASSSAARCASPVCWWWPTAASGAAADAARPPTVQTWSGATASAGPTWHRLRSKSHRRCRCLRRCSSGIRTVWWVRRRGRPRPETLAEWTAVAHRPPGSSPWSPHRLCRRPRPTLLPLRDKNRVPRRIMRVLRSKTAGELARNGRDWSRAVNSAWIHISTRIHRLWRTLFCTPTHALIHTRAPCVGGALARSLGMPNNTRVYVRDNWRKPSEIGPRRTIFIR